MRRYAEHLDYYGRYKALHYYARRFYAPVALGLFSEHDKITINVANEKMEAFEGYVKYGVRKNDLTTVYEKTKHFSVMPLTSLDVESVSNTDFNGHRDAYFYAELYDKNGVLITSNIELGTVPKHFKLLKPSITAEFETVDGGTYVTLSSDVLAKDVEISFKNYDIELSDNYFDISSKEPFKVYLKTTLSKSELEKEISIFSVYDISKQ